MVDRFDNPDRRRQGYLHLTMSPTTHAQLAQEADERGMPVSTWAMLKLKSDASRRTALRQLSRPRRVPKWRTHC